MQIKAHRLTARVVLVLFSILAFSTYSTMALAWGSDGHTTVGILAIKQLNAETRNELEMLMGSLDEQTMVAACNWPDVIRKTEEWSWTEPLHYINIPRGDFSYMESRDCPEQQCVTEAINRYASTLADHQVANEQRRQAFAWLCHLVGDLHQPLHAGYADDRGGNNFDIDFNNRPMNLHTFWDFELINQHAGSWQNLVGLLSPLSPDQAGSDWSKEMVIDWTNQSHDMVIDTVYPPTVNIDESYALHSWKIAQQQIIKAANRLALIINSVLKSGN